MTTIGTWVDNGPVISTAAGNSPLVPNVLYEAGAKILSGTVFKMWYTALGAGGGTNYAESADGITWTQYSLNPVILGQGFTKLFKNGSTYYAYTSQSTSFPPASINVYTSSDGITWVLAKLNAIVAGSAGAWDSVVCTQLGILGVVGGTWYGYYTGSPTAANNAQYYPAGLATSTDGINWTKSPSNPIITGPSNGNFTFAQENTVYYGWSQATFPNIPSPALSFPSDIGRWSAENPAGPWTFLGTPTYYRTTAAEGVGITLGQVADPCFVEALGNLYMFFSYDSNGVSGTARTIGLATATGMTLAQLTLTNEGVQNIPIPSGVISQAGPTLQLQNLASDNFTRANANPIGGNWTPLQSANKAQIVSNQVESSAAGTQGDSFYNGLTWPNDQWSQCIVGPVVGASSYVGADVRMTSTNAFTTYRLAWGGAPTGSSGTWFLQKFVAGVYTQLGTGALTVNVGDVLTLCVIGTTLSAYWNGVLLDVVTDSTISSGNAGFLVLGTTSTANANITGWSGGNFVGSPVSYFLSPEVLVHQALARQSVTQVKLLVLWSLTEAETISYPVWLWEHTLLPPVWRDIISVP